ncbi:NUDIX domain-containing protein [Aliarcobacter butzleri]|uniref:NUDIX domain-containing protein n=1 Tax=Aliarcobacter butzleri TaxID=28197 RepID=UPI000657CDD7|nr:NUDIX domain-containing protein [Aliarcobacter butzleri]KLE03546.1 UDP-sugar diphosphatase [Aliarcobacter butzleri L353]MCT7586230.1 NUDIX domain-containing protein [Aliarcobacter butzleri]MCT7604511.1 NUDIX domain-containing protein [Aliarcobacter butzleri]MDN5103040.1 NUDIX domain-containing protein [Aliarcobacter butzleri]MDN5124990.1 NUDIX domain-containing protein [Aliarcobacter butzleri]
MTNIIENLEISSLEDTKFIKPLKVTFNLNGKRKTWEAVRSHDSVSILLYHTQKNAILLVKQFRVPVYLNDKSQTFTYELCAGLVDKEKSLEEIAIEEIDEECGYEVNKKDIQKVTSFFTNVGISGAKQHLYFAKIDESMKIHDGGGVNDEQIELYFLPINSIDEFIFDESKAKTPGLIFSLYWFLKNKNGLGL